jgi:hypothetical protein
VESFRTRHLQRLNVLAQYDCPAASHPIRTTIASRKVLWQMIPGLFRGRYLFNVSVDVTKYLCVQRAMLTEESESESGAGETVLLMHGN